jgi:hypothetical protein
MNPVRKGLLVRQGSALLELGAAGKASGWTTAENMGAVAIAGWPRQRGQTESANARVRVVKVGPEVLERLGLPLGGQFLSGVALAPALTRVRCCRTFHGVEAA